MKTEWKSYWKRLWKETKASFLSTILISLVFFAAYYPMTSKGHQHINFYISFSFGFAVFFSIWILFASFYAFVTYLQIKRGGEVKLFKGANLIIALVGMGIGSVLGTSIKAKILGGTMTFNAVWFSILFGIFIALMFHFYYSFKTVSYTHLTLPTKA